jgi:2-keto-4-pentenoate hydratase/2-oxohepta-3-ene-1,7-dioic acid hydratase in catechol pathway
MSRVEISELGDFSVTNIYCIGRNFVEHARELGNEIPKEPVVFLKPTSSLVLNPKELKLDFSVGQIDHEVELVLAIGQDSDGVEESDAFRLVEGYGVGLDLTAREIQEKAKAKGLPWAQAKGRKQFGILGPMVSFSSQFLERFELELSISGVKKQWGNSEEMIFSIPRLVSHLSQVFGLKRGDLIYTGTPRGVGPIKPGVELEAHMKSMSGNSLSSLSIKIV